MCGDRVVTGNSTNCMNDTMTRWEIEDFTCLLQSLWGIFVLRETLLNVDYKRLEGHQLMCKV